jgi:hypothetical protein
LIVKVLDILRIAAVCIAFFFGYQVGYAHGYNPAAQLHFMIPVVVCAIAGLSGIEGLFFGRQAAEIKGYETGSNYQRQSAIALLSYAFIAWLVCFLDWGLKAELTILFTFFFFFIFSAVNHAVDAVKRHNYAWQNINRPFLVVMLAGGFIYPVVMALKELAIRQ